MSYMGLVTRLKPNVLSKPVESLQKHMRAFVEHAVVFVGCPECQGTPLAQYVRESYLNGVSIAEVCDMELAYAHLTLICVEHHRPLPSAGAVELAASTGRQLPAAGYQRSLLNAMAGGGRTRRRRSRGCGASARQRRARIRSCRPTRHRARRMRGRVRGTIR